MKTFSEIAVAFLQERGLEAKLCTSEDEAREASSEIAPNNNDYPVYFFSSDTSGEKSYEEFYMEGEEVDLVTYEGLGVIQNAKSIDRTALNETMNKLSAVFDKAEVQKSEVLALMKELIPNFEYIDRGKNLDSKM